MNADRYPKTYGFYTECVRKYGSARVWTYFTDMFDIEATEWDDGSVELQPLSDSLGIKLGTAGQPISQIG